MAGFERDVLLCDNVNFNPALPKPHPGLITLNGQLIIGSTALNAGGTHLNIGFITSTGGSIVVTNGAGTINLEAGATTATTYQADVGSATPLLDILQILGGPGVTTTGAGSTLTINSVVFTNTAAATLAVDNGYFATAAGTYPLPATATQGEMLIVVCDTAGAVVLDAPALNFIRLGTLITSSGGTITSTSIGDSVTLRYRLSTLTWEATSIIGTWLVA